MTPEEAARALRDSAEYEAYTRARKAADTASPIAMPKADGLLHHAEKMLKQSAMELGLNPQEAKQVMTLLKSA